jgi:molybdenum ABC transporter molybdate-binding protein
MKTSFRDGESGGVSFRLLVVFGSLLIVAGLLALLLRQPATGSPATAATALVLYCAAGIKSPVETVTREYEKAFGGTIQLQYGGSGTLLSNLRVAKTGDLYLAGDESYIRIARAEGLLAETLALARQRPVVAVRRGNPKNIRQLDDLWRNEARVAFANPDAASIGRTVRDLLQKSGQWAQLEKRIAVFKPTVGDVANDVKIGSVDAGIIWDATASQYPELEMVRVPLFDAAAETVTVGVLSFSRQPSAALRFARYLAARDKGLREFAKRGYEPVDGDEWHETPEIVLYSGGVNRPAIEDSIRRFEEREGARVTRVYNGCGILVAQMRAGGRPDAYLTCDESYLNPVADLFESGPVRMSETDIVILVPKGNPKGIASLRDLGKPGLRVGVTNAEQSTLGALTRRLLEQEGLLAPVMANVVAQAPTADMLVNQIRTGSLDAVVVYAANTMKVREQFEVISLRLPGALAVQTFSVGKNSKHKQLASRFLEALRTAESRSRYEASGFRYRGESK